ncbi:alpha-amylase family glycosyl hydrolase [Mucilaginibacter pocheonensis]|uniref:1,4-alpha-glucan branching enzyme n=1 Tax=Mucilaginibacter pocheonensis TaxID=398050 RepID=A0ABU1TFH0_9SPHI|nr:alpha-amylase family glycosyl hydrolase [Mucilaginibacter pocheonensis]MDR6944167.1 1,4-alpha-glucan branching enzyme [Mucilaginibacter pocheonensis]
MLPIYSSPNDDNGYDVSNYSTIMKDFGSMAYFDALLKDMHEHGIKLVMDLVVNHSSDEPPYHYSLFDVNHDVWRYDSLTNAYYLHYFSRKQRDLNWLTRIENELNMPYAFEGVGYHQTWRIYLLHFKNVFSNGGLCRKFLRFIGD